MNFKDIINASKIKKENQVLLEFVESIKANELFDLANETKKEEDKIEQLKDSKNARLKEIAKLDREIENKKNEIIVHDEAIFMESFALYKPKYDFDNSDVYKGRLDEIRSRQKSLIKSKTAATGNMNWQVNGKKSQGKKMVNDMIKLVLRSFNNECDTCITKVKFNNIEASEKRMTKSFEALNKLGKIMDVRISPQYKDLKFEELYLAYEYQQKKKEEKEEQKLERQRLREQAKLQKEIEEARKSVLKEQKHYSNALDKLKEQLSKSSCEEEKEAIQNKIAEVESQLEEIDKNIKDIDYREANQRAGYVYVISNIGSFGEDVYKIGMTRRLEPLDRVKELGDASVPFDFDLHAMIFSDDAPGLEKSLHKAFEDKKVNMINWRREFFNVSLSEIEKVVKANHDKSVEFVKIPAAEQFRESKKIAEIS